MKLVIEASSTAPTHYGRTGGRDGRVLAVRLCQKMTMVPTGASFCPWYSR